MALQKCDHKRGGAASAEALMGQFRRFCGSNLHLPESGAAQAIARTEGGLFEFTLVVCFDLILMFRLMENHVNMYWKREESAIRHE